MKQVATFRLNNQIIDIIETLAKKFDTTKTDIIEKAVDFYNSKTHKKKNKLAKFAGALPSKDMDDIMEIISNTRTNRKW